MYGQKTGKIIVCSISRETCQGLYDVDGARKVRIDVMHMLLKERSHRSTCRSIMLTSVAEPFRSTSPLKAAIETKRCSWSFLLAHTQSLSCLWSIISISDNKGEPIEPLHLSEHVAPSLDKEAGHNPEPLTGHALGAPLHVHIFATPSLGPCSAWFCICSDI